MTAEIEKRTWIWAGKPLEDYEMADHECGSGQVEWSEYAKHLWCKACEVDYIPAHAGIFDGPVPVNACRMMGIPLVRIDLTTGEMLEDEALR